MLYPIIPTLCLLKEAKEKFRHLPHQNPLPLLSHSIEGHAYSWGRIGRLLTESAFLTVLNGSREDLWAVDLCSSLPILREIMTGQHKERMHSQARKITGTFIDELHVHPQKSKLPIMRTLDAEKSDVAGDAIITLRKTLAPKNSEARQLLTTPIFDLLLNPPPPEDRTLEAISSFLFEKFMDSHACLANIVEPKEKKRGEAGSWTFIIHAEKETSLSGILTPILGNVKAEAFLKDVSDYFGRLLTNPEILPNIFRRINFLSLDNAPFKRIAQDARMTFPLGMRETLFFKSAQTPAGTHIYASILNNPFHAESIGFFSSIEGWPYYGSSFGLEGNLIVAKQLATQLARGGKAVFFPWLMQGDNQQAQIFLDAIEEQWGKSGLEIEKRVITKTEILTGMASDRELVLADHSPALRNGEEFTCLTLSKPRN